MKGQACFRHMVTAAIILGLTACSGPVENKQDSAFCAENEILTYEPVDLDKTVITLGKYVPVNFEPIEAAIEARFPEVDIVPLDMAGVNNFQAYMELMGEQDALADIIFGQFSVEECDYLYDLSAEAFTSRYNLSSLNALNADGRLYQLPISSVVHGIFYNKTLFEEHGWEIPSTLDDFYALCDTISAQGIRPFVPCFKYRATIQEVGLGLSNRQLFETIDKQLQYDAVVKGEGSCAGLLEPYYEVLKNLYDRGIVVEEDFSSSLTQNRHALYEGKIAMIPNNLDMFSMYEEEKPDCEVGFIGYFTDTPGERWLWVNSGRNMALSQKAMEDPEKKQVLLDIFDFLSTNEGQEALFQCFTGISSVKSYQMSMRDEFHEIEECIQKGQIFFAGDFGMEEDMDTVKDWITGKMTMEEIIDATDHFPRPDYLAELHAEPLGTADETFTMLETSSFIADTMREATGADIALLLHKTYYKGNFAQLFKGDIHMPERFYLRGLTSGDFLTTYEITGANLKTLMEHPIINDEEVNAMYACSGLHMEYAPWYDPDRNVLKLTLENGKEIDDTSLYTVAAWATSIDDSYISSIVRTYPELGSNIELMTSAIKQIGTVSPPDDKRITLRWE